MAQIDRAEKNRQFQAMGEKFVKEYPLAMGHLTMKWFIAAKGCMEQLGRMVKAEMEADAIAKQAKIAAAAINEGRTVKQVEAYLRHGRITGEWNESLLTATREAATAKPHPNIIEYLTIDDLRGISTYLDVLYECVTKETTVKKLKKLTRKQIKELHEDIDNLNGRIAQTVLYTEAQEQFKGDSV